MSGGEWCNFEIDFLDFGLALGKKERDTGTRGHLQNITGDSTACAAYSAALEDA